MSKSIKLCVCMCVLTQKLDLLPQPNEGEDGHVVAHTDEKNEPQGNGEVFHIRQFDHFTW